MGILGKDRWVLGPGDPRWGAQVGKESGPHVSGAGPWRTSLKRPKPGSPKSPLPSPPPVPPCSPAPNKGFLGPGGSKDYEIQGFFEEDKDD